MMKDKLDSVLRNEFDEQLDLNRYRASEKLIERGIYAQLRNAEDDQDSLESPAPE